MAELAPDFYAEWRSRARPSALHEGALGGPPERWMQQLWRHQRLRRAELRALDGRPVRVLHPGFWNRGPGPDFQRAVLQFGGDTPQNGDVELDLAANGWHTHGHDRDPRYRQVILHVVWERPAELPSLPTLVLPDWLDTPLPELAPWLDEEAPEVLPLDMVGQCCAPLRDLPADQLAELLQQAAHARLRRKAGEFASRARHVGWEQVLWEGLFGALGYRHNVWPLRRLAEVAVPLAATPQPASIWEARLLGLAGWLPDQLPAGPENAGHTRALWDLWWRERDAFHEVQLPRSLWQLAGIRPANHPQRRLALAAQWLACGNLPRTVEGWLLTALPDSALLPRLLDRLCPPTADDSFWAHHWTLRSPRLSQPHPLLGAARTTDLAVNVILPWLQARAAAGGSETLLRESERRYFAWPAGEDNAVLRLTRARLFGGGARRLPRTAAIQQGLLQVTRDFCDHANALCAGCQFPELVRTLPRAGADGARGI